MQIIQKNVIFHIFDMILEGLGESLNQEYMEYMRQE